MRNRPNMAVLHTLQRYSTRAWVYRDGQGWLFAEMTPDERAEFRSYEYGITIPRMWVRVPHGTANTIYSGGIPEGYAAWFCECTIRMKNAKAISSFGIRDGDKPISHPEQEGTTYVAWLWDFQYESFLAAGLDATVGRGFGWREWNVPFTRPKRVLRKERTFIYALIDPLTKEVRYVGKADKPERRYNDHLTDKSNLDKAEWIEDLRRLGEVPVLTILEEVDALIAYEREQWWIRNYEERGHLLTNAECRWRFFGTEMNERLQRRRDALQKVDDLREKARLRMHWKQAQMHGQAATLTLEEWAEILAYFDWKCAYCGNNPIEKLDYLVPFLLGGGTTADNCIPVCSACKAAKKTLSDAVVFGLRAYFLPNPLQYFAKVNFTSQFRGVTDGN